MSSIVRRRARHSQQSSRQRSAGASASTDANDDWEAYKVRILVRGSTCTLASFIVREAGIVNALRERVVVHEEVSACVTAVRGMRTSNSESRERKHDSREEGEACKGDHLDYRIESGGYMRGLHERNMRVATEGDKNERDSKREEESAAGAPGGRGALGLAGEERETFTAGTLRDSLRPYIKSSDPIPPPRRSLSAKSITSLGEWGPLPRGHVLP